LCVMKRNLSARVPSPTPTSFSGISNYRTDSYRPIKDQGNVPVMTSSEPKSIARTHFNELSQYLAAYLAKGQSLKHGAPLACALTSVSAPPNSRSTARQKLTRLTKQQFQELSTDVYDELIRRKTNSDENEGMFRVRPSLTSQFPYSFPAFTHSAMLTRSRRLPSKAQSSQAETRYSSYCTV